MKTPEQRAHSNALARARYIINKDKEHARRAKYNAENVELIREKRRKTRAAKAANFMLERSRRAAEGNTYQRYREKMSPEQKKEAVRRNNKKQYARRKALGIGTSPAELEATRLYQREHNRKQRMNPDARKRQQEADRRYRLRLRERNNGGAA
jgi:hypothetical protein